MHLFDEQFCLVIAQSGMVLDIRSECQGEHVEENGPINRVNSLPLQGLFFNYFGETP